MLKMMLYNKCLKLLYLDKRKSDSKNKSYCLFSKQKIFQNLNNGNFIIQSFAAILLLT